ncbi:CREC-EF hand family protein [Zavarzinella formosa]|uniref:hypothetical protein n=1 Tax=Zavarzinella formosa TaxID=360055 RepID=UPI0002F45C02|nr:hypothetical protein [Zavarzinella formosa]
MTGRFSLLAVVLTAGVLLADESKPRPKVAVGPRADHLDLIALAGDRVLRIQFQVEIDGKSVCALQDEAFAKLFAFVDRDGNGVIDQKEAVRLPSAFSLRQNIWGQFGPYGGQAPSWTELDADGDGKLTLAELIDFHRRAGLGGTVIGIGRSANADVLSSTILKALDTDGDKIVTAKEWQAAPAMLSKFDRNDDEMVSPAELVSKVAYPGAIGATMLPAPSPEDRPAKIIDEMPLITLPLRLNDTHWATVLIARRDANKDGKLDRPESDLDAATFEKLDTDKDGKLGPAELLVWRTLEPDIRCRVMLGESKEGKPAFEIIGSPKGATIRNERFDLAVGNLRLEVRHDVGKLPSALAAARKRIVDRFTQTDVNGDGVIDEKEAAAPARNGDLVPLLAFADRDADGKLTRKEFDA